MSIYLEPPGSGLSTSAMVPSGMHDLSLVGHLPMIRELVGRYLDASVELVEEAAAIDGKHGRSRWNDPVNGPAIAMRSFISAKEIEDSLLAMSMRGHFEEVPELRAFANSVSEPLVYLKHLVLHEVAHIVNNWTQADETKCDLWAIKELSNLNRQF